LLTDSNFQQEIYPVGKKKRRKVSIQPKRLARGGREEGEGAGCGKRLEKALFEQFRERRAMGRPVR